MTENYPVDEPDLPTATPTPTPTPTMTTTVTVTDLPPTGGETPDALNVALIALMVLAGVTMMIADKVRRNDREPKA